MNLDRYHAIPIWAYGNIVHGGRRAVGPEKLEAFLRELIETENTSYHEIVFYDPIPLEGNLLQVIVAPSKRPAVIAELSQLGIPRETLEKIVVAGEL